MIIPTQGRETLRRCLESCVDAGLRATDDQIVVVDRHEYDPPSNVFDSVRTFATPLRVIGHDAGHHCWGHCQLNVGIKNARGHYILCQDDDDIYAPGAFDRIRAHIAELETPRPLLFRFQSWWGPVYWDTPGVASEGHIGGHCAVFPNDERLGRFTCRYQGDFDYIRSTLDNWGGDSSAVWVDDVIAIARPAVMRRDEVLA